MKFKIDLPKLEINQEQRDKEIKAKMYDDFEKGGWLNHTFIFCNINEPASVTEINNSLCEYYKREFERVTTFRVLDRLFRIGLVNFDIPSHVLQIPSSERTEMQEKILIKYFQFLKGLPEQFRRGYGDTRFYWVSNGNGQRFVPFSCKLLNFKCEEDDNQET